MTNTTTSAPAATAPDTNPAVIMDRAASEAALNNVRAKPARRCAVDVAMNLGYLEWADQTGGPRFVVGRCSWVRSDTWLTYGEQKHHVHLSHAFTTLGHTRLAHVSQERALELSAPTSTMTRTLLNIDAAACSHHDGDTEQACRRTVAALTALPADYRTGLVRRRALDLYETIPAQHHHEHAVSELRDVLAA